MDGCPSHLQPYLGGEDINRKSKSWKTTSFGHSIMGNQHYNGQYDHLDSVASFVQNQRLAYKLCSTLARSLRGWATLCTFSKSIAESTARARSYLLTSLDRGHGAASFEMVRVTCTPQIRKISTSKKPSGNPKFFTLSSQCLFSS